MRVDPPVPGFGATGGGEPAARAVPSCKLVVAGWEAGGADAGGDSGCGVQVAGWEGDRPVAVPGGVAARVAAAFSAFVEGCIIALLYNYSFSLAAARHSMYLFCMIQRCESGNR